MKKENYYYEAFLNVDLTFPGEDFSNIYFPLINNYFVHECIEDNNLLEISDKLIAEYSYENKMIGKPFQIIISVRAEYYIEDEEEEEEREEEREEEQVINTEKTFKSDKCVICLTNLPNILFCNCGHMCLCAECDKVKSLAICPVCKTKNTIKRII